MVGSIVGASCNSGGAVYPGPSLGDNSAPEGLSVGLKNSIRLPLLGLRRVLTIEHLSKRDFGFSFSVVFTSVPSSFSSSTFSDPFLAL